MVSCQVQRQGFEPCSSACRPSRRRFTGYKLPKETGLVGFEPTQMPESKSGALPLGNSPLYYRVINSLCGKLSIHPQNSRHSGKR